MEENDPISAEEGADRVAKRRQDEWRSHVDANTSFGEDDSSSSEEEGTAPAYTCEHCGAHVFLFYRTSTSRQTVQQSLECSCGETDTAAVREYVHSHTTTEVGQLGRDHRVDYDDCGYRDEIEEGDEWEEVDSTVGCEKCLQDTADGDWDSEELGAWEEDTESLHVELRCAQCDHEIEFGWSHPDRGGRIWPCEGTDFSPWMTFPEPRFLDNWRRRGWLRPER